MDSRERLIIAQRIDLEAQRAQLQFTLGELVNARVAVAELQAENSAMREVIAEKNAALAQLIGSAESGAGEAVSESDAFPDA